MKERRGINEITTTWEIDSVFMTRQLLDVVPNPWVAHEICDKTLKTLLKEHDVKMVGYNIAYLIEELRKHLEKERDRLLHSD